MKTGRTLQELAIELDRQSQAKRDLIVDTGALHMDADDKSVVLNVGTMDNNESFNINEIAHRQLGQHLKIPASYYDRMSFQNCYLAMLTAGYLTLQHAVCFVR